MTRVPTENHIIEWRGITIEICYEADWLSTASAHLDIRAIKPERTALPITETGYRSHFAIPDEIADMGGPVAFVLAWLDDAAKSAAWRDRQDIARQLMLF